MHIKLTLCECLLIPRPNVNLLARLCSPSGEVNVKVGRCKCVKEPLQFGSGIWILRKDGLRLDGVGAGDGMALRFVVEIDGMLCRALSFGEEICSREPPPSCLNLDEQSPRLNFGGESLGWGVGGESSELDIVDLSPHYCIELRSFILKNVTY